MTIRKPGYQHLGVNTASAFPKARNSPSHTTSKKTANRTVNLKFVRGKIKMKMHLMLGRDGDLHEVCQ